MRVIRRTVEVEEDWRTGALRKQAEVRSKSRARRRVLGLRAGEHHHSSRRSTQQAVRPSEARQTWDAIACDRRARGASPRAGNTHRHANPHPQQWVENRTAGACAGSAVSSWEKGGEQCAAPAVVSRADVDGGPAMGRGAVERVAVCRRAISSRMTKWGLRGSPGLIENWPAVSTISTMEGRAAPDGTPENLRYRYAERRERRKRRAGRKAPIFGLGAAGNEAAQSGRGGIAIRARSGRRNRWDCPAMFGPGDAG